MATHEHPYEIDENLWHINENLRTLKENVGTHGKPQKIN